MGNRDDLRAVPVGRGTDTAALLPHDVAMLWLLCEYDGGNAPLTAMFLCTDESVGFARSGIAKLNYAMGWSCRYTEFAIDGIYPEVAPIPDDAVMVTMWFDSGRCILHPETHDPVLPPICLTAMCRPECEEPVMHALARLFRSRGWTGEMTSGEVYRRA